MKNIIYSLSRNLLGLLLFIFVASNTSPALDKLEVKTTVPDLADLASIIGGDEVRSSALVKGGQDPHFIEAKPSFIKALNSADIFVKVGLDLEVGWVPVLIANARNARILPGAQGHIDASSAIEAKDIPSGTVTRAMGDIHAFGSPHYLLDPLNGLKVAALLRDRFSAIRPEATSSFSRNYELFKQEVANRLFGELLTKKLGTDSLIAAAEAGRLSDFLQSQGSGQTLAGWLGQVQQFRNRNVVSDHKLWSYFAERFGLSLVGEIENKPGIPPTSGHLQDLIVTMRRKEAKVILTSPYFDTRSIEFVSERTGAKIVPAAHQVGSRGETETYLKLIGYNVTQLMLGLGDS